MEHTIGIIGAERIRVFRSRDPVRPNIREKLNIYITNTTLICLRLTQLTFTEAACLYTTA